MNYSGKFDAKVSDGSGLHSFGHFSVETVRASHAPADAIVVPSAHLLFNGDFKRSGLDLVLSKDGQELVLHDYFKGEKRAALSSPDGAHLTGDVVKALAGHVDYAQAGGSSDAGKVIGHVTKLVGTATALRNGVAIILNNGDNVEKGDVVQSGSDSTLGITFIDGTVFGMLSNSRMVLNEMVYDPNGSNNSSLLSLVAGTITFVAGETAKHGDMKIDTPVATMGIRGTAVLSEIDFQIPLPALDPNAPQLDPTQFPAPTAKFQVLVEPDGTTGSYILFDKATLTPLAVVDKAGQQINISQGQLNITNEPLPPDVQKLINDVFSLKFTDNSNTKTTVVQNDSIVPNDGRIGFKLPDGSAAIAIFANLNNPSNSTSFQNNTPAIGFIPFHPAVDQSTATQGKTIHTTGAINASFAWQVSSDSGKDWTTVSGATNYTPTEADEGKLLQLIVTNGLQSNTFGFGTVQEVPDLVATFDRTTVQEDAPIHVTGVTDGGNPVSNGVSYAWQINDGHIWTTVSTASTFTPTDAYEGRPLQLIVTYTDQVDSESSTYSFGTVATVAETPNLSTTATHGAEGGLIALNIVASGQDADDIVSINITGVPKGATLTDAAGVAFKANPDGSYTLTSSQLVGLHLDATKLEEGPVTLHVVATNTATGEEASVNTDVTVTVDPAPEAPNLSAAATHGAEGGLIALNIVASGHDADDVVSINITGVPKGATLTDSEGTPYTANPDGSYTLTPSQLSGLQLDATKLEEGPVTLHVVAANTTTGEEASVNTDVTVTVDPAPEAPNLSAMATHGAEGGLIALNIVASPHDADDIVSINITGVPKGATLTDSEGTPYTANPDGSYTLTPSQLSGLQLDASKLEEGPVTLHVVAANTTTGEEASVNTDVTVTVDPAPEAPNLSAMATHGAEGGLIALNIVASGHDADDIVSINITGVPKGATLTDSEGTPYTANPDGSYTLTPSQLSGLQLDATKLEEGPVTLHVVAANTTTGEEASVNTDVTVTVDPAPEAPNLSAMATHGAEGGLIALNIVASPHDADDIVSINITGVPKGATLTDSEGTPYTANPDGSYTLTPSQLSGLQLDASKLEEGPVTLHVVAANTTTGEEASVNTDVTVTVDPAPEAPNLSAMATHGAEGGLIALNIVASGHDADDIVSINITGVPKGATLTDSEGTPYIANPDGSYTLTPSQLIGLQLDASKLEEGPVTLHVVATNTATGEEASVNTDVTVTVDPAPEAPNLSAMATHGAEGGLIALNIVASGHDADDIVSINISGVPKGATLTDAHGLPYIANPDGSYTLTPSQLIGLQLDATNLEEGPVTLHVVATNTTTGEVASTSVNDIVTVDPVAEPASLAGTVTAVSGSHDSAIPLTIVATPFDSDGLSIQISGVPGDATLSYVGADHRTHTLTPVHGIYTLTPDQLNGLKFNADEGDDTILHVVVTSSEGTSWATSSVDIAVTVDSELTISSGDTYHFNGGTLTDHSITVDGTLIGFGSITGTSGTLANIVNNGTIESTSNNPLNVHGNISGTGVLDIKNNTTMELGGSVGPNQSLFFNIGGGSLGELVLDNPGAFQAKIFGFNGNDVVDLKHLAYSGATSTVLNSTLHTATVGAETISLSMSSAETVITMSESGTTATIKLEGNYTGHSFTFSSDGAGGTQFVDPLAIYSGATLELQGASAENVSFVNNAGISGTLVLDDASEFSGEISGFAGTSTTSDAIDVKGVTFDLGTKWTYTPNSAGTSGILAIYEGSIIVDTIDFAGNYTAANFKVQSDGNGGTLIADPPTSGQALNSVIMHDPGPAPTCTIVASAPNQTLAGSAASDNFVFNFAGVGHSAIADFRPATDVLQFSSTTFANALAAFNATHDDGHGNSVIAIDAHDGITLNGVLKVQLHATDFHVV